MREIARARDCFRRVASAPGSCRAISARLGSNHGPQDAAPEVEVKPDAFVSNTDLLSTLTREHRQLDERLRQLDKQISMTAAERIEYCLLKKRKLLMKDRIARITASA
jgi:uncharacterized protein YdcH (DUF465 family)